MQRKHTIGLVTAGFMVATALFIDGAQFLLSLTVVLVPFSMYLAFVSPIIFFLWFAICGVKYSGKKGVTRLLTMLGTSVAEFAPILGMLPMTTVGVVAVIALTRIEDAQKQNTVGPSPEERRRRIRAEENQARLARMRARVQERREQERQQQQEVG